ncbi:MAG TPA: ATP-binding protein [Vicinamibacterales bacterium]|jgi:signal transduction histidine kinase
MATQAPDSVFVGSSELAALMRDVDWSRTAVGPVARWPQSVRAILRMMLTSRYAMWMGWGPELTFFYNDAYARMTLAKKHPWALGKQASEVWAEIWPDIGPRIQHVLATGEATWDEGLQLFLERSGFPEETYHTFSYSPLHQDEGAIAGMFCVVTEETDRVIGERRMHLLRELGAHLTSCQTVDDVWRALERSLADDARDLPFTLTYVMDADASRLMLASSTDVAREDPVARAAIAIDDELWPVRALLGGSAAPVIVDLPDNLPWPAGPWPKAPTRAMAMAIPGQGQLRPAGVFIAGLNPFRRVDAAYESFVTLYVGQLASALANVQAYAAERHRAEALAQIDRAKTTFFSNVSHELRTPLTLMLGPVTDALIGDARSLSGESLDLVYRNGLRLRKLVNALLEFSRIEAGRIQASYQPIELGAYTAELASAFESAVRRAGLRYVIRIERDEQPTYVDRDMWEKIVLNLISNAFKFTFEGEIAVSLARQADGMVLEVRDSGTGIPAAELPRIFERFHRVEGARGRTQEGTGIGLALVQELVKLHGGSIAVDSVEGQGTKFTVTIPAGSAHLPADRLTSRAVDVPRVGGDAFVAEADRWLPDASDLAVAAAAAPVAAATDAARIVLADDNADMRGYLARLLGARWHVETAPDGEQALAVVNARRPDLVVTDVMMPKLDGFALLRALRADPATRDIPVMMLSARAGEESRVEGFEAGADDYLVKPFTAREMMARVEAQLLRVRMRAVEDEHRRRLEAVFSHAPVSIAILRGPTHIFELANGPYLELVAHRDIVGRPIREALAELEGQGIHELLDHVYRSGERYVGRADRVMLHRGADLELRECFFNFVYEPTRDASGRVDGIAVVAFEVTELVKARQTAEDASRAKDEFLAMLGHELRNPLAPIVTALQLLRLRGVKAGERERTIIERQVRHLVGLVDDLLDISRVTRGKIRLSPIPTELSEAIAKGIELASPLLEQHQHDLTVDVATGGLGVSADPARLAQVISNLLTNAAKYTPPGGRIRVSAALEGDWVVLRVRDSGMGIDAAMLPRIFDLFTQDRQAIDRAQGGLGLGLAIVRSLVALHGGTVSVYSEGRGRGSEFVVRLPHLSMAAESARPETARLPPASTGLRVLVVDDNEDAAVMLSDALTQAGHQTAVAHDGPTALQLGARFQPHVALLDIGLPVMDGFELARQIRASAAMANTRLVAVTGYGQEHDRQRTQAAGFDAHLIKPVDLHDVTDLIVQLAGGTPHANRIQS